MSKIPERFIWATELLSIKSTDNILEIGCGTGILAEQIANQLVNGKFVTIDRSEAMIEKAKQRKNL